MKKQVTFQQRVRELQLCALTMKVIGERIGISEQGVWNIANGRNKQPLGDTAIELDRLHRRYAKQIRRAKAKLVASKGAGASESNHAS